MARVGRPTRYTDAVASAILAALRYGATEADAAGVAGVPYGTYRDWKDTKPQFSASVDDAKYQAKVNAIKTIADAAYNGDWKAALEYLKRRHPSEWGDRSHVDVTIRQDAERIAEEMGLAVEDVQAEVEAILAARR